MHQQLDGNLNMLSLYYLVCLVDSTDNMLLSRLMASSSPFLSPTKEKRKWPLPRDEAIFHFCSALSDFVIICKLTTGFSDCHKHRLQKVEEQANKQQRGKKCSSSSNTNSTNNNGNNSSSSNNNSRRLGGGGRRWGVRTCLIRCLWNINNRNLFV